MQEKRQLRRDGSPDGIQLNSASAAPSAEGRKRRSREEVEEAFHGARGESVDLFVYGTLMSDNHVRLILNRTVASEPVTLFHYMKVVPPGAFYFIVRQRGSQVRGRLLKGLTLEELERLDGFEDEGRLYYRRTVVVRDQNNQRRRCMTYVGNIPAAPDCMKSC